MKRMIQLILVAAVAGLLGAMPVDADSARGNGKKGAHEHKHHQRGNPSRGANCPPGLAKKNPPCIPPGQAHKHDIHYGKRVGDIFRVGDYVVISDPRRYNLKQRQGWEYYRDDDRIYRVDSGTRQVLAILNLIDAFTN